MALGKSTAVVLGSFPLGESDRVVTFFARQYGKVRGVAKAARRLRSRFAGALELGTLGELVFFDTGRSDLVRVDHFDVVRPFARVRDALDRLGQTAWMAECVARLTADRDPNAALYGLLVRALRSVEAGVPPRRVAVVFGVRAIEALGHRLRIDACAACGARAVPRRGAVAVDVDAGGVLCPRCALSARAAPRVDAASVSTLRRLRVKGWDEAVSGAPGRAEHELHELLEAQVGRLIGHPTRSARFVRAVEEYAPKVGGG